MFMLPYQCVIVYFVFMASAWFLLQTAIISLNNINKLKLVMMKWGVHFEVRTEFLYELRLQKFNPLKHSGNYMFQLS
jgi:hypothetical protein